MLRIMSNIIILFTCHLCTYFIMKNKHALHHDVVPIVTAIKKFSDLLVSWKLYLIAMMRNQIQTFQFPFLMHFKTADYNVINYE